MQRNLDTSQRAKMEASFSMGERRHLNEIGPCKHLPSNTVRPYWEVTQLWTAMPKRHQVCEEKEHKRKKVSYPTNHHLVEWIDSKKDWNSNNIWYFGFAPKNIFSSSLTPLPLYDWDLTLHQVSSLLGLCCIGGDSLLYEGLVAELPWGKIPPTNLLFPGCALNRTWITGSQTRRSPSELAGSDPKNIYMENKSTRSNLVAQTEKTLKNIQLDGKNKTKCSLNLTEMSIY